MTGISRITIGNAIKIALFSAMLGFFIFLMIEVLWGAILTDTVLQYGDQNSYMGIALINLGFLLSLGIGIFSSYQTSEQVKRKFALLSALVAYLIDFVLWIGIAYLNMWAELQGVSGINKLILFPRVLAYYSIFHLANVTLLWAYAQITFAVIYVMILLIIRAPVNRITARSKNKRSKWL